MFFTPDIKGEGVELVIQGFDIDPMEARLILGGKNDSSDFSDILDGIGGSSIGAEALKALAEGFESRRGNVIKAVGEYTLIQCFVPCDLTRKIRRVNQLPVRAKIDFLHTTKRASNFSRQNTASY